jgi:hypothetical protein
MAEEKEDLKRGKIFFRTPSDDEEPFPWISLSQFPTSQTLFDAHDIVIKKPKIKVLFDYPLKNNVVVEFAARDPKRGFTRLELVQNLARAYEKIYEDEDAAVGNPGHVPGMLNRAQSEGPYGIWGHDLRDLDLSGVYFDSVNDTYRLVIES